jgi:phytoene dehydrogenase-like protein
MESEVNEIAEYDIAIIGAGVAALTAALLAARLGHSTFVIERTGGCYGRDSWYWL